MKQDDDSQDEQKNQRPPRSREEPTLEEAARARYIESAARVLRAIKRRGVFWPGDD